MAAYGDLGNSMVGVRSCFMIFALQYGAKVCVCMLQRPVLKLYTVGPIIYLCLRCIKRMEILLVKMYVKTSYTVLLILTLVMTVCCSVLGASLPNILFVI